MKNVLFDLDGTLLAMDQDEFVKMYFKALTEKMSDFGYEPEKLMKTLWTGVYAMVKNPGEKTNEEVFWNTFESVYGKQTPEDKQKFEDFYRNEFQSVGNAVKEKKDVNKLFNILKKHDVHPILATAPLFPSIATRSRIRWAGMNPDEFSYISTYENSHSSKPMPAYYEELIHKLSLDPKECIMIGNDTEEDMVAEKLGMQVYLVTDYIVNKHDYDVNTWSHGTFDEMLEYLDNWLSR